MLAVAVAWPCIGVAQIARPAPAAPSASIHGGFNLGDKQLSVGILTGGDVYSGFGAGAAFEVGVYELTPRIRLGVGGSGGYLRDRSNGVTASQIPVYAIGNLHLVVPSQPKLDLYAGGSFGVTRIRYSASGVVPGGVKASSSNTGIGIQGGAHYQVSDALTVMGQIGLVDIPLLFAGVGFRF
jgi:opacity protein-like surface antigen